MKAIKAWWYSFGGVSESKLKELIDQINFSILSVGILHLRGIYGFLASTFFP